MSGPVQTGPRRGPRILVAVVLLFAIGALFGVVAIQLRDAIDADTAFVTAERSGVEYMRPVSRLVIELSKAQSAAVRNAPVDAVALQAAVSGVSDVDGGHGLELRTEQRWADLRTQIESVTGERPTGAAAMQRYGDLIAMANELARRVADTSNLILDPQLDSYYLMDTVLLQLPTAVTAAGRAADRTYLTPPSSSSSKNSSEPPNIDVAVDRYVVASSTDTIGTSVRKALDQTDRSTMGARLTEPLDVFRAAAAQLASPVVLKQADNVPDARALADAASHVRDAALPLANAVLDELDGLLAQRQQELATQRLYALASITGGVVLGVVLLWWAVPARGRGRAADLSAVTAAGEPAQLRDVASVSVQLPAVDARDLLAIEELVHVGRGVRARPRDESNAE
jgi:hypothetical protein